MRTLSRWAVASVALCMVAFGCSVEVQAPASRQATSLSAQGASPTEEEEPQVQHPDSEDWTLQLGIGTRPARTEPGRLVDVFNLAIAVQLFLVTVVTFLGGVLTFLGYREWRSIAKRAEEVRRLADDARSHAQQLRQGATESLTWLETTFRDLGPEVFETVLKGEAKASADRTAVIGADLSRVLKADPEALIRVEDADDVLKTMYHLGILPERALATRAFIRLGRFWRHRLEFARSKERLRVAGELATAELKSLVEAQTAVTLSNWAGWLKLAEATDGETAVRDPEVLLAEAQEKLSGVIRDDSVERMDLLFLSGTILHLQERFPAAIESFRKALEASKEHDPRESLVETTPEVVRYNLAASLCRAGRLEESVDELRSVPRSERIEGRDDPDFEALRSSDTLGPVFRELTE